MSETETGASDVSTTDIAITGMAIRCPGAANTAEFWHNLVGGTESISFFDPAEVQRSPYFPADPAEENFVPAGGVLPGIDLFDAPFFGFSPAEAELMDPQHRLFLETAWSAMEDAGHDLTSYDGTVCAYVGSGTSTYSLGVLQGGGSLLRSYQSLIGNEKDYLATRLSYKLNLSGESVSVQTACSTSLVAVHLACQSLLTGQSDIALAGGVSVQATQKTGYTYHEDAIFSPDGHCRAFDAAAGGTVFGSGLGVVVLRPLRDALGDGDQVHAVIKGSAVNNDARAKVSYTAPSLDAQAAVVVSALEFAELSAEEIGYVETHGTGTALGDPIEIEALTRAFRQFTERSGFCPIGSVKTNVGHLDAAAGMAGLIKTALALRHRRIPPSLHFSTPNPNIDFAASPFFVNTELRDWASAGTPRRAGVSSFGIGGTNAHVVLEEAPSLPGHETEAVRPVQVLTLSAKTEAALRGLTELHRERLTADLEVSLPDYCFTANEGRAHFEHRVAVVGESATQLGESLRGYLDSDDAGVISGRVRAEPSVAFLFTGQGGQYPGMGMGLYRTEREFRLALDECQELLAGRLEEPLLRYLDPADPASELLDRTRITQPVLFALEYALTRLWESWGVRPDAVIGHSLGEYVAACIAGVFSLEDGLRLVAERGRLMSEAAVDGAMLAVHAPAEQVAPLLNGTSRLAIAAFNTAEHIAVSGDRTALRGFREQLREQRIPARELPGDFAFHSPLVEPVLPAFGAVLETVHAQDPKVPLVSSLTGRPMTSAAQFSAEHWLAQVRQPVLFADGVTALADSGYEVFLEVGPHPTLTGLGAQAVDAPGAVWLNSLRRDTDEQTTVLAGLAGLHVAGVAVDWNAFHDGHERRRLALPTYPFERHRYWIELNGRAALRPAAVEPAPRPADGVQDVEAALRSLAGRLLRVEPAAIDVDAPLVEAGMDSLVMIEAVSAIKETYGVRLNMRSLLTELTTLSAIARHVHESRATVEQPEVVEAPPARTAPEPAPGPEPFVPHRALTIDSAAADERLTGFVADYTRRTGGSKRLAGSHRQVLSDNDNLVVSNFRMGIKEMVYPIVADRSRGSRLWDVDGNEYLDVVMGYGVNLFGHSPDFVTDAVRAQLDRGVHIGAQSHLAGQVAAALSELTGMGRVVFCNSGSEAVMTALRLARAATGRSKVAMFAGSYHGIYDGTLGSRRRLRPDLPPAPVAPGILQHQLDDLIVLDYDDPEALESLHAVRDDLAAVLVEPVQSRRPDVQPTGFLRGLRELATETGAALVFDEIITGLRTSPGGAQQHFGVRADLATYGKVLGGGLPIGAVAGDPRFLDAVDGGAWNYGDDSYPSAETTFHAGTFCKHPLAMAASLAVLTELRRQGAEMQERVNRRTDRLAAELNGYFAAEELPVTVAYFGSLFRFMSTQDIHLLFYQMVHRGVHIRQGHNAFLSTAHDDTDVDRIVGVVKESVAALREMGVWSARAGGTEPQGSGAFPLTPAQRQLWTLAALDPEASAAYNQISALELRGEVNLAALRAAVNEVLARHESLRTVFDPEDGTQRVLDAVTVEVPVVSPPVDGDAEVLDWIAAKQRASFDLARGPLLRCGAVRLDASRHLFFLAVHHIAADGLSVGLLLQEIADCYSARVRGQSTPTVKPMQFRAYACWLQRQIADGSLTEMEEHWTARMSGELPVLDLPSDRPRPVIRGYRGARHTTWLDQRLLADLRQVAAAHASTLFMLLLASYQVLLHRLTGQRDLIVGVPVAGRTPPGSDTVIGHCINVLPIRGAITGAEPFRDVLAAVSTELLDAHDHQDYPIGLLVERLGLAMDPARTPLVETVFNLDRAVPPPELAGLSATEVALPSTHAQFDLGLNAVESDAGLRIDLDYATELFDADTVARWAVHFERLLRSIVDSSATVTGDLRLLAAEEHAAVTSPPEPEAYRDGASLGELLAEQAARTPDAVSLRHAGKTLTFRELDERSNQVAACLRAHRIVPGDVVGVCLPRSPEQVIAILGAVKAGAAYLPLSPAESPTGAAAARLVIADTSRAGRFPVKTIDLDETAGYGSEFVDPGATADHPAYMLFTSGSTGCPKGVLGTHRAVVNRLSWMWRTHPFVPGEVACLKTASTFVDSVAELFGPLLAGVPIVVLSDEIVTDPITFVRALAKHSVSRIVLVPSLLRVVLATLEATGTRLPALTWCVTSGEVLPSELAGRFREVLPDATLLNLYGSTEVMGDVTVHECQPEEGVLAPIGRPIANTSAHVLDGRLNPVPAGVVGEVYVAGPGVAIGYADAPAATALRFVPDPFGGARMYRTGDLARRRPDGVLEFAGRADAQLKVRGVRVEPGAVEEVLTQYPDVRRSAVSVRTGEGGDTRLVAHIELGPATGLDPARLRAHLAAVLPPQAVPGDFVAVERLPLTASGKLDRALLRELPVPSAAEPVVVREPATPVEDALHDIWSDVLGIPRISTDTTFFDAGATSLAVMRLVPRISEKFGVDIGVRDLFRAPTIAGMAAVVADRMIAGVSDDRLTELLAVLDERDDADTAQEE